MTSATAVETKPAQMTVIAADIPDELTARDQWVCWRWEWNGKKWDKPPYQPNGAFAKTNDPSTWCSFDAVIAAYESGKFDGIGYVFAAADRYLGIDLDDCRDPETGELTPDAQHVVDIVGSYTEISPSGTGVKIIAKGRLSNGAKSNTKKGIELYDNGRYFCLTGKRLSKSSADVRPIAGETLAVVESLAQRDSVDEHVDERALAIEALEHLASWRAVEYDDWIRVGMALHSVDPSLLPEWQRFSAQCPEKYDDDECNTRWNSFGNRGGSIITIGSLVYWARNDDPNWRPPHNRNGQATNHSHVITNSIVVGTGKSRQVIPVPMPEIIGAIKATTGDWPRRIESNLFVDDRSRGEITWLENTDSLFAWLGSATASTATFRCGADLHTRAQTFQGLRQFARKYRDLEMLPHEPPIEDVYYACGTCQPGDGAALRELVGMFNPATAIDGDLILAMFVTLFWGGPPGARPAFIITSDDGRGSGKTMLAEIVGQVGGGSVNLSANEDAAVIRQRLLSPEGMKQRVVVLDNVKTHRFSWAELESLITAQDIDGKRMYVGEAHRLNTITWVITLNGVSLATDLAERSVVIKLKKPPYSPTWYEKLQAFIRDNHDRIVADCIGFLRSTPHDIEPLSRWSQWESAILSRLPEPRDAQALIRDRKDVADVETEETGIVVEYFDGQLERYGYDALADKVFIPSRIAADWWQHATNDKASVAMVSRILKQKINEGKIANLEENKTNARGRGFVWQGACSQANDAVKLDLPQRIAIHVGRSDRTDS